MSGQELPERDAADYQAMLQALLPRGLAWTRALDAGLTKLLAAAGEELARVDAAARLLLAEVNPETAISAIDDWERVLGLPDDCLGAAAALQERRAAVLAKLRDTGRQDMAYWYGVAATLGYAVTIEEHWSFLCGWHQCGDPQGGWTEQSGLTAERLEQDAGYPIGRCGPEEIRYWWHVLVGDRVIVFRCGESLCPEPLMDWRDTTNLECVMHRDKPAHTLLTFEYREE